MLIGTIMYNQMTDYLNKSGIICMQNCDFSKCLSMGIVDGLKSLGNYIIQVLNQKDLHKQHFVT